MKFKALICFTQISTKWNLIWDLSSSPCSSFFCVFKPFVLKLLSLSLQTVTFSCPLILIGRLLSFYLSLFLCNLSKQRNSSHISLSFPHFQSPFSSSEFDSGLCKNRLGTKMIYVNFGSVHRSDSEDICN